MADSKFLMPSSWTTIAVATAGAAVLLSTAYVIKLVFFPSKKKSKPVLLKDPQVKYPVVLVDKEELSPDTKRFRFKIPSGHSLGLPVGKHIYLSARINGELVVRPYTPVSSERDIGFFDLVVKVYKKGVNPRFPDGGKLSQYMDSLEINDSIDVRGPGGLIVYEGDCHYAIKPDKPSPPQMFFYRRIGMIAGGTGITPMLQLVREMFHNPNDKSHISLIFGNQTPDDILLRGEIDDLSLEQPNRFKVWYTVDRDAPEDWKYGTGFISEDMMKEHLPPPGDDVLIVMCGPPPMTSSCKANLEKIGHKNIFIY